MCTACGELKPLTAFRIRNLKTSAGQPYSWRNPKCKDCYVGHTLKKNAFLSTEELQKKKLAKREYDRRRRENLPKEKLEEYREGVRRNAKERRAYYLRQQQAAVSAELQTEEGKKKWKEWRAQYRHSQKNKEAQARYKNKNPALVKAHQKFSYAVRHGHLEKPTRCSMRKPDCGHTIHGHHEDYSKPLDVVWLCDRCHNEVHLRKRGFEKLYADWVLSNEELRSAGITI